LLLVRWVFAVILAGLFVPAAAGPAPAQQSTAASPASASPPS